MKSHFFSAAHIGGLARAQVPRERARLGLLLHDGTGKAILLATMSQAEDCSESVNRGRRKNGDPKHAARAGELPLVGAPLQECMAFSDLT